MTSEPLPHLLPSEGWLRFFRLSRRTGVIFKSLNLDDLQTEGTVHTGALQRLFDESASHLRFLDLAPHPQQPWNLTLYRRRVREKIFSPSTTSLMNLLDAPVRIELHLGQRSLPIEVAVGTGLAVHLPKGSAAWGGGGSANEPLGLLCARLVTA